MTTLRAFTTDDLFMFNGVNLDALTETYNMGFYMGYIARWPEMCLVAEAASGDVAGYVLGKAEGSGELWHGHVTALTVSPTFRRQRLAERLMNFLEEVTEIKEGYFVDLFVRVSNAVAISMYEKFGYSVYRRVLQYYAGEEDAFDMRKAMSRDVGKKSVIPLTRPVRPDEIEIN